MATHSEVVLQLLGPLVSLALLVFVTYWDALKGKWVSDDWAGILFTDESRAKLYQGELRRPITLHNLLRWARWHAGKQPNPDRDWQRKNLPPYIADPVRHHRLNLWLLSGVAGLLYLLLDRLFSNPSLAFAATALFVVHPFTAQVTAWISGIGYLLSMTCILLTLHVAVGFGAISTVWAGIFAMGSVGALFLLSLYFMYAAVGVLFILPVLGLWAYLPVTLLASALAFRDTMKGALDLRSKVFKEQNMSPSTKLHPRKIIVALKTLTYYTYITFFPKRLGLYHTFGYHYELPQIETEDAWAWAGLGLLGVLVAGLVWAPPPIQLGIAWYLGFICLFLNWITANQFVSERYAWIPLVGPCIAIAWACVTYNATPLLWLLTGILLMRTWAHLPTYYNETQFYLSNLWNHPGSEVAVGNLGCAYLAEGQISNAMESWTMGVQINPEYDVNWYNLSSIILSRGPFNPNYIPRLWNLIPQEVQLKAQQAPQQMNVVVAGYLLEKAVKARTCHFNAKWEKELDEIKKRLQGGGISSLPLKPMPRFLRKAA